MNSRKTLINLTQTLAASFKQGQQQIQLDEVTANNIEQQIDALLKALENNLDYTFPGQDLVSNLFTMHPNIAHLVPRDMIWLLGGPCLHHMSDEELEKYNELDERRYNAEANGETFDWSQQKAAVFKTH